MYKTILSCLLLAAVFTPLVLSANEDIPDNNRLKSLKSENFTNIDCSGRCESCPNQNCPRRRRPYQKNS